MAAVSEAERWRLVRRLYEGRPLTVEEIASVAGVATRSIANHAVREGWARRGQGCRLTRDAARRWPGGPPVAAGAALPVDRAMLLARLWAALDRHVQAEEADPGTIDARRPQTLDVLVRTIERLSALERAVEAGPAAGAAGDRGGGADAEALRAALLRRIEALAAEDGGRRGTAGERPDEQDGFPLSRG